MNATKITKHEILNSDATTLFTAGETVRVLDARTMIVSPTSVSDLVHVEAVNDPTRRGHVFAEHLA